MEILILVVTVIGVFGTLAGVYYTRKSAMPVLNQKPHQVKTIPSKAKTEGILNSILTRGSISVGIVHYPPLLDFDENGNVSGLYAVIIKMVAKKNNLKIKYKPLKWNELRSSIEANKVDIVMCIFPTPERLEYADFGAIMHRIDVGAVALDSNQKVVDHEDLNRSDVQIAVTKGEVGWEYAKNYLALDKNSRRISVIEEFDIKKMMGLVKSEVVDVALADALSCHHYCNNELQLVNIFTTKPLYVCDNGIMFKKGESELKNWLDNNFNEVRRIEQFQRAERSLLQKLNGVVKHVEINV